MMNDTDQIIGVTMGWSGDPQLRFKSGKIYFKECLDYLFHPEYFPDGKGTWPKNPQTNEKLPIVI